jgi:hypothetical protein
VTIYCNTFFSPKNSNGTSTLGREAEREQEGRERKKEEKGRRERGSDF